MPPLPPKDFDVPALEILLGSKARHFLNAAVTASGGEVDDFRVTSVRYLPGKSVVAQFRVTMRDSAGTSNPTLVASSGISIPARATTTLVPSGDEDIAVWKFPHDPFLPGLALATDVEQAAALVKRLGTTTDRIRIRTRAYRAGRRAVVELIGPGDTVFIKVLRPDRIAALRDRHVRLAPHLPVARSLGWSPDLGVIATEALGGATLRHSLESGISELPTADAILLLLDQFPAPEPGATMVRAAHQRISEHATLLRAVLPGASRLVDSIATGVSVAANTDPMVAVHGDFHSAQVLVDHGRIVGLVDIDTVGAGQRIDDIANMVGQLATLAMTAENPAPFKAYNTALLTRAERQCDADSLRRRVAAVIVGLATGPFRVQLANWPAATERRLRLAQLWLESVTSRLDPINP